MKIILIGSGNVAYNMANLFAQNNITVTQVISRNAITGKHVATICGATYNNNITTIPGNTTVIVITTQDANIKSVVDTLPTTNAVIIHTSGTTPINAVANKSPNYGILYPLQSLMYGVNKIPEIPFLVQASNISTNKSNTSGNRD